ncbi:MAG: SUMF1/EgtB/PvdO family nonheme iron enzyme, partial [Planctomycetota bacterium]
DAADTYNEWYKTAAWMPLANPPRNGIYGFGRNTLTTADANYRDSGDLFDNGTTPVETFDGVNANAFGVSDLSGNVYQWVQDRFSNHSGNLGFRTIRGGSWNDPVVAVSLKTATRSFTRPDRTDPQIGFRIVRTLPPTNGDFDQDGDVDRLDVSELIQVLSGPGSHILPTWMVFDFDLDGDIDLMDVAKFQRIYTGVL